MSMPVTSVGENQLLLRRFCGDERFTTRRAGVFISRPAGDEPGGILLNLEIRGFDVLECTVTPEEELPLHDPSPVVEVWLPVPSLALSELVGTKVTVEESYDASRDAFNRLYYCEHEPLWAIEAEFVEASEDRCRVRLRAKARDINHYGGDKPDTLIFADAWFCVPPA